MASIMIISEHERETQILKLAFEQKSLAVKVSSPNYQNFVKIQQYVPDILLLELPRMAHAQLHFVELIKRNKKTRLIPIISYGDALDESSKKGLLGKGLYKYLERPLKFSVLLDIVGANLKKQNKDMVSSKPSPSDKDKDVEQILSKETLGSKKIELMTNYVAGLMAFPFTVARVLQLAQSDKSAASDLAKVIQTDAVISAQLLKISNSVLFASLNRRIGSVKDAIIRVGFRETKRLVMSMSVMKLFSNSNKNLGFDRAEFWYHSLVCGIIAERLAKQIGTVNVEEAFLAGILHDFGILLLDEFFPEIFSKILEETANKGRQFIVCEKEILGVTHNDMIAELFAQWKLPESITDGIVHQYQFREYKDNLDTPSKKFSLCVGLSDILAKTVSMGRECDQFIAPVENWVFEQVKMPGGFTKNLLEDIADQMKLYQEFLMIDKSNGFTGDGGADAAVAEKARIGMANCAKDIFIPPLMYLQKEGYAVTSLANTDSLNTYNGTVHLICLWADDAITAETIKLFGRITKFFDSPMQSGKPTGNAPVLVFIDEKSSGLAKNEDLKNVSFVSKSFDVRQLDANIPGIIEGAVVRLAK